MSAQLGRFTMHWQFEWKVEDCWIGAFWRVEGTCTDLWICLVPCIPLHVSWWPTKERDPFEVSR